MSDEPTDPIDRDESEDDIPSEFDAGFDIEALAVPVELHSCEKDGPFETCVQCGDALLESARPYFIEKVRRDGETVVEFALCMECADGVGGEMSEESRQSLEGFLGAVNFIDLQLDGCNLCGETATTGLGEHMIGALAIGNVLMDTPRLICFRCGEQMEGLLSRTTRDGMEDFTTRNFPGVPEGLDMPLGLLSL